VNQVRPPPQKAPRAPAGFDAVPREDLDAALEIIAKLEGKPMPTMQDIALMFDVSQTTAFRMITHLKRRGVLKVVDQVRLSDDVCHCIADLRTRLADRQALERLEARLRADPAVSAAAAVTGKYSYRVTALHAGMSEANAWFKALLIEPVVIDGALTFCRRIFDRQHYARAILGADAN
jgi:DNA-binding Lrp family transcriptional regulator